MQFRGVGGLIVPLPAVWLDLALGFEFDIEMLISGVLPLGLM